MATLDVSVRATNEELKKTLAESSKLINQFAQQAQKMRVPIGNPQTVRSARDVNSAIRDQRLELAQLRTAQQQGRVSEQQYRIEAARLRAELVALRVEKANNRRETKAASGSYREAQLRLSALGKVIRESSGGLNLNSKEVQKNITQYRLLNAQLKQFDRQMGLNYRNVGNYSSGLGGLGGELATLASGYLSVFAAVGAVSSIVRTNARISDSIADIQRTAELSQVEARGLFDELKRLETRTGLGELAEISVIGGQLGIAKDELAGFTEAVDMLSVVLSNEIPGGAEAVTEALGKINGVFRVAETEGLTAGQAMEKTGSAILTLGQAGLATGEFLVNFTQRVGGAARTAGIALPTMLAYGATLEEAGVSAEVAGTAISKLIGQLAVRRKEFHAIAQMADANLTLQEFTDLINTDADAAMRKFFAGLAAGGRTTTQFYDILGSAKINTERYRNAVLLLSQDQEKLTNLTRISTEEFEKGTIAAEQFAERNNTLGASIDKLSKAFQVLTTSGEVADFFKTIVDGITETISSLDRLANAEGWEFLARASTITLAGPTGIFGGAKISDTIGNLFGGSESELKKQAGFVEEFADQSVANMERLLKVQEEIVEARRKTYEAKGGQKNLEELKYQSDILYNIRQQYADIKVEAEEVGGVQASNNELTKEQKKLLEQRKKDEASLWQSIRSLREENHLNTLEGYEREIQAVKYKYADELTAAKNNSAAIIAITQQRVNAIARIIQNTDTLLPSLQASRGFGIGETRRAATTAEGLSRGEVVPVELPNQIAKVTFEGEFDELTKGLRRASRRFVNNMQSDLQFLREQETKQFGDYLLAIGNSVFGVFESVINNTLANQLESMLDNVFEAIGSKGGKGIDWQNVGAAGLGIGGQIVQGATRRTSVGGQTLGGALSGAAAGTAILPGWGTAIGAVVGAVGGLIKSLGARRQEKISEQQLEEQRKQTELMERQQRLSYTSQIIGQQTRQGVVTGVERNEFGDIEFRIEGRTLKATLDRENAAQGRGL